MKKKNVYHSLYLLVILTCSSSALLCGNPQGAQEQERLPEELIYLASIEEAEPMDDAMLCSYSAYFKVPKYKTFFPLSKMQELLRQATEGAVVMQISTRSLEEKFFRHEAASYRYQDDTIPAIALTAFHKPQQ